MGLDLSRTVDISNDSDTLCTTIELVLPDYQKARYVIVIIEVITHSSKSYTLVCAVFISHDKQACLSIFIYLFHLKYTVNVVFVASTGVATKLSSQEVASLPQTNRTCHKTKNQLRILNINF